MMNLKLHIGDCDFDIVGDAVMQMPFVVSRVFLYEYI